MPQPPRRLPQIWTLAQRRVVLGIVAALLGYLLIQLWLNPARISNPQSENGSRAAELQDRIDPNTADVATLSILPTLGEKRASEIVAYREHFSQLNPGQPAFTQPRDLLKVKGIGVSMVTNLEPYLYFPGQINTTRPSP